MKKYALPLALVTAVTLTACNEEASTQEVAEASTSVALENSGQRLSYGIAYGLGQRMVADGVPMDVNAFAAGLRDAVDGAEPRLTQEEIQAEMMAYQEKAQAEAQAAQAAAAEANQAASEAFLSENAAREGVVVTDSGLQYEILEQGEGVKPQADDVVEVNYRGTLVDGTEFDSSYKRGESVKFGVGQVIPGWTEALQLMPAGSKWKLFIPSDLAYGAGGAGGAIGPNAALVFEVELISVLEKDAEEGSEG
ncbi:FKBP-type peptidyl-prolyl cis-trans isomerase [Parahaliea sp. F7430]|uniref:Peptidyl-prolyl cis-trans isomerase n=1 Tax=Sediminihaliea albiluteola TaxID=2758564 RepID=A0A7W2TWL0_9GAMM|nr:FKBP-type peptidyl-prolyl cis-trans isomerase [Sediminihaliea albiluteola]MBA6413274.1 FKBP-type peptidyl-prolyl cis-trans isomerase [Sediminihaliea albiluteola]